MNKEEKGETIMNIDKIKVDLPKNKILQLEKKELLEILDKEKE